MDDISIAVLSIASENEDDTNTNVVPCQRYVMLRVAFWTPWHHSRGYCTGKNNQTAREEKRLKHQQLGHPLVE